MNGEATQLLSVVSGPTLSEEPGLGTLTLPGFLRDVTSMYGAREALAFRAAGGETHWTYTELWERAVDVACALRANGVGKDTRVGVLMTNRPEWISAFFGITLAGAVAVTLSTFSTPAELEYLLNSSCVAILLFERKVLKTDFAVLLSELAPEIATAAPWRTAIRAIPVPPLSRHGRRCALRHRHLGRVSRPWSRRTSTTCPCNSGGGAPERCGSAVFLVRLDEQAQRYP